MSVIGRRSSGVEHFHGKEGVSGSNPDDGSKQNKYAPQASTWGVFFCAIQTPVHLYR